MDSTDKNIAKVLKDLHQLEVDANNAYEEAIKRFRDSSIKSQLMKYKLDHESHLTQIEQLLAKKNFEIPERSKDLKGLMIETMTILRSSISDEQALKVMKSNEETVIDKYQDCLDKVGFEHTDVRQMIQKALDDESKHLSFILSKLDLPSDDQRVTSPSHIPVVQESGDHLSSR